MKKIFIILITLGVFFTACETDFKVNAAWEEVTVVYGLLDASLDTQYIRINKAYLGDEDAIMMAQYADSINFIPANLEVKLHKLGFDDTLLSISLDTTLIDKQEGLFAFDNNIIYRAVTPSGFLSKNNRYGISIKNGDSGNEVSANTEIINDFSFKNFNPAQYVFSFYNPTFPDSSKFLSKTLLWNKVSNGVIYQLDIRFNYLENGELRYLIWNQPLVSFTGSMQMNATLEGAKFFNYLRNNLEDNESVTREFVDLDLVMTVGTDALETYIKVNEPITGIVQQRPLFTNINNGIGIFSSRYTHTEYGLDATKDTKNYITNKLNRNFE